MQLKTEVRIASCILSPLPHPLHIDDIFNDVVIYGGSFLVVVVVAILLLGAVILYQCRKQRNRPGETPEHFEPINVTNDPEDTRQLVPRDTTPPVMFSACRNEYKHMKY